MKVIIDTNILVSAIFRDRVPEAVTLFIIEQPDIEWIVSDAIIAEYEDVLQRKKFNLPSHILQRWFSIFDQVATNITVTLDISFPRDQKDAKFLACALTSDADFLITGDRDFEDAQKMVNTKIIPLHLFKKLVVDTR